MHHAAVRHGGWRGQVQGVGVRGRGVVAGVVHQVVVWRVPAGVGLLLEVERGHVVTLVAVHDCVGWGGRWREGVSGVAAQPVLSIKMHKYTFLKQHLIVQTFKDSSSKTK